MRIRDWSSDVCSSDLALSARCAALEPAAREEMGWAEMMRLSLFARLGTLIAAHRDCRDLYDQMVTHRREAVSPRVGELLAGRRNRELHRDHAGAARGAFGAFVTIALGCALWIGSGWRDGGTAVMLAGVFLSLLAGSAKPG